MEVKFNVAQTLNIDINYVRRFEKEAFI